MYYTDSHEWVDVIEGTAKVGITQYAQKELGEIVYVELPQIGQLLKKGQEVCVLESTKAAADVYAPISGKVVAINDSLKKEPSLLNRDPEKAAWLFQIELTDAKELDELLSLSSYEALIH